MLANYTYVHSHDCKHKDETFVVIPEARSGVEFPIHPVCVETGAQLELVKREVF